MITNPILPGFHPDPSIVRVGEDYYIAVSTFEWFPGILIYHSRDLAHWRLAARPLNRKSQLDMLGNPDSGGIWAPCLSYSDGTFFLVYTDVKSLKGMWRDMRNYLVTAERVEGDWSEPVYLNGVGHDPSLYHDEDGKKWLVQVSWDFRQGKSRFGGIALREYSAAARALTGPAEIIFEGSGRGYTEAPHLYMRHGYYYLITAEGGTWYDHCVTLARSRSIRGPFELHPRNPILTSKEDESLALQKAGHADLVETQNGEWYMVHLCGRPLEPRGRCVLGRETAIQKVEWRDDDWLYLSNGTNKPELCVPAPRLPPVEAPPPESRDDFDDDRLGPVYQTLRIPLGEDVASLRTRQGFLRLIGKDSFSSVHAQSLVARRQQSFRYRAETCLEFMPETSQQLAGLVAYYNTENYAYLCLSCQKDAGPVVRVIHCNRGATIEPTEDGVPVETNRRLFLRIEVDRDRGQFYYSTDGNVWIKAGPPFDYGRLSDDFITGRAFTGTFIGLCCQDLSGKGTHADFDYFDYEETSAG